MISHTVLGAFDFISLGFLLINWTMTTNDMMTRLHEETVE